MGQEEDLPSDKNDEIDFIDLIRKSHRPDSGSGAPRPARGFFYEHFISTGPIDEDNAEDDDNNDDLPDWSWGLGESSLRTIFIFLVRHKSNELVRFSKMQLAIHLKNAGLMQGREVDIVNEENKMLLCWHNNIFMGSLIGTKPFREIISKLNSMRILTFGIFYRLFNIVKKSSKIGSENNKYILPAQLGALIILSVGMVRSGLS